MAFGQSSGPPASPKEIEALAELIERLDFGTFRQARHHLGLTQRQANGKFTRAEVAELTERLIDEHGDPDLDDMLSETRLGTEPVADPAPAPVSVPKPAAKRARSAPVPKKRTPPARSDSAEAPEPGEYSAADEEAAARLPDGLLADELTRRGWCCIPPLADT